MKRRICLLLGLGLVGSGGQAQGLLTQVGVTDLRDRYGSSLANGSSVVGWVTEEGNPFWPNLGNTGLFPLSPVRPYQVVNTGINPTTTFSSHADAVAQHWFGSSYGVSPGLGGVVSMGAGDFVSYFGLNFAGYMGFAAAPFISPTAPLWETGQVGLATRPLGYPQVINASWIGTTQVPAYDVDILRRADYLVDRDGITIVAGVNNAGGAQPELLGQAYNVIAVGLPESPSSNGTSYLDGSGRIVVDIVAPSAFTSYATPMVSGAATLLIDLANKTPELANGNDPRVVRSVLMTGAEKSANWTVPVTTTGLGQTVTQPLDLKLGAGELRVNMAYELLRSGEVAPNSVSAVQGWDLGMTGVGMSYYFVDNFAPGGHLTVTLAWNRVVGDPNDATRFAASNFIAPASDNLMTASPLANLDLQVFSTDGVNIPLVSLAASVSTLDNVEHIHLRDLPVGRYAIGLSGPAGTVYGLSFQFVPEAPVGMPVVVAGVMGLGWVCWRRRCG
jgi:hypothetical protein